MLPLLAAGACPPCSLRGRRIDSSARCSFFEVVYAEDAPALTSEDVSQMSRVDAAITEHKQLLAGLLSSWSAEEARNGAYAAAGR